MTVVLMLLGVALGCVLSMFLPIGWIIFIASLFFVVGLFYKPKKKRNG